MAGEAFGRPRVGRVGVRVVGTALLAREGDVLGVGFEDTVGAGTADATGAVLAASTAVAWRRRSLKRG